MRLRKNKSEQKVKEQQAPAVVVEAPKRRLSLFRVLLAIVGIAALGYFSFLNYKIWESDKVIADSKAWFAAYVDVTATPQFEFEKLGNTPAHNVVLSFIVSAKQDPCLPTWGTAYTMDKAGEVLDLDRRIARLRQLGGDIAISFGGLLNHELAINCKDENKLLEAYLSVINKYEVYTLDFDLEGDALLDEESQTRRATVLANLQSKLRSEGKNAAIWLTLPVTPGGLIETGTNAVSKMLAGGVDLSGVNIMTMDYGQSREKGQNMQVASERALIETHRQLSIIYSQVGIELSSSSLWKKIGATPMIGQNDVLAEVFTLEDAEGLNKFILDRGVIRTSMWSANRDIQCGENYVNVSVVSDSCSGVIQNRLDYSYILSKGLEGNFVQNVDIVTTSDSDSKDNTDKLDDPENSPYQIWKKENVYLQGTKVVWHKNVYQAKWWTQGDLPDNPVLQSWQTPWQLVGPVLPGEKPIKYATLPDGTYPKWSGNTQYDEGDRVLFNDVPYQAKWWTQGDSPAAATSNPTSSPWVMLTQIQIEEVLKNL